MAISTPRVTSYMKNVAKSFGYAIGDVMQTYNPVVTSLAKETKETVEDLYSSISDFKYNISSTDEKSLKGEIRNSVNDIWKNFKDDIKTGNLYNKQRMESGGGLMASMMGFDMDDMDFDFDEDWGDDFDFDDDGGFDEEDNAKAIISANEKSTKQIVVAADIVGSKVANTVASATAESASFVAESSRRNTAAMYSLNQRGFNQVTEALLAVNNSVTAFAKIGEPLSAHMQNSSVFFTKTTEAIEDMRQTLKEIAKNTTPTMSAGDRRYNTPDNTLESILAGDDGTFSIDAYKGMVANKLKDYTDMLSMISDPVKEFMEKNKEGGGSKGSLGKNISIGATMTKWVTSFLIPNVMKESMKSFNETLKHVISGGIIKLRDSTSSNMIVNLIKDIFVPDEGYKRTANTANYEKGAVAWDGVARKALVEVIPTTLLKIYSAITGKPEKRFDYDDGKFVTMDEIRKNSNRRRQRAAADAGGRYREDALYSIENSKVSKREKARLKKEVEQYFLTAFNKGGSDFININSSTFDAASYGLTDESLQILKDLRDAYRKSDNYKIRNRANRLVTDVNIARDDWGNRMRMEEASGISNENYLNNGLADTDDIKRNKDSKVKSSNTIADTINKKYNHSMSFYLAGIYQYTGYLADNIGYISGKTKKIKKRRKLGNPETVTQTKIEEPVSPTEQESTGEKTRVDALIDKSEWGGGSLQFDDDTDDEEILKERERQKQLDELNKKGKGIWAKIKSILGGKDDSLLKKPFAAVSNLINKITDSLDVALWGDKDGNGLIDIMKKKFTETMEEMKKKIKEFFNPKIEKLKNFLFGEKDETGTRTGGLFANAKTQFNESINSAKRWLGRTADQALFGNDITDNGTAAHGKKVTKSGIVAVSEGELIVPSELNPYYHGITNKAAQIANEESIVNNFYGSFAGGGTAKKGEYRLNNVLGKPIYQQYNGDTWVNASDQTKAEKGYKRQESIRKRVNAAKGGHGVAGRIYDGGKLIYDGVAKVIDDILGGYKDKKEGKKDREKGLVAEIAGKFLGEAKDNPGHIAAGALIGGGVSLLTGAVVGPLFGAAIGATVALTKKSTVLQKVIFGRLDENDRYEGGILNAQISNFLKDHAPKMGKGAAIGTAAGLFMGSPVLGAVLGTTAGYISSSESAKEYLFGKKAEDGSREGGIIPKEVQQAIKTRGKHISAGAILGAAASLVTPLGLVGGILVGGSLGYVYDADKFHQWMFGDGKDDKGLTGLLKEKIFDNIDNIFHNMLNTLKGFGKNLLKQTGERVKDFFTKRAKAYREGSGNIFDRVIGGTVDKAGKAIKGTVGKVGDVLDWGNRKLEEHNLKKGYDVYNREEHRNMFAGEREEARIRNGIARGSAGNFDNILSRVNSLDELNQLQQTLEDARDPKRAYKRQSNEIMSNLYSNLKDLNTDRASEIGKLIKKGKNLDEIKASLSEEELSKYGSHIEEAYNSISGAKANRSNTQEILKQISQKYGVDFTKQGKLENAIESIKYEKKHERFSEENQEKKNENDWRVRVRKVLESLDSNVASLAGTKNADGKKPEKKEDNTDKNNDQNKAKNAINKNTKDSDSVLERYEYYAAKDNSTIFKLDTETGEWSVPDDQNKARELYNKFEANRKEKSGIAKEIEKAREDYGNRLHGGQETDTNDESVSAKSLVQQFMDEMKNGTNKDEVANTTTSSIFGVTKYSSNNQGEAVEDLKDTETKKTNERREKFFNAIDNIPLLSTAISGVSGILGLIKGKLFGDEKKEGVFSKLFKFFTGENGILSHIFNYITGTPFGKVTKSILGKISLKGVLSEIIGPALLGIIISGKLDNVANVISPSFGRKEAQNVVRDKRTGEKLTKNEDGVYVNSEGEEVSAFNITSSNEGPSGFGSKFIKQTIHDVARGKGAGSIAGKLLNTKTIKKATKGVKNLFSGEAGDLIAKSGVAEKITSIFGKMMSVLRKVPFLGSAVNKLEGIGEYLSTNIIKKLNSLGSSKIATAAKGLKSLAGTINVAMHVMNFITGWQDANATLGILDKPTFGQKLLSGLIRLVKGFIPFIGDLIPDRWVLDLIIGFIGPVFGISKKELLEKRAQAQAAVDEYNATVSEDERVESFEEYNKKVLKNYTWTEKIGNGVKSLWTKAKQGFSNDKGPIKSLFKSQEEYQKSLDEYNQAQMEAMSRSTEAIKSTANNIFSSVGNFGKNVAKDTANIFELAKSGDIKSFINYGDDVNKDGTKNHKKGFGGFLQEAMMIGTKSVFVIPAGIFALGNAIGNGFTNLKETIVEDFSRMNKYDKALQDLAMEGKPIELWKMKTDFSEKSPIKPLFQGVMIIDKLFKSLLAVVMAIVNPIGKAVNWIADKLGISLDQVDALNSRVDNSTTTNSASNIVNIGLNPNISDSGSSSKSQIKYDSSNKISKLDRYRSNKEAAGAGSGIKDSFVSQLDPKYRTKKFGDSTIGQKGCAPAVATMIANQYGKNLSMDNAASAALKYQNNEGTTSDYFRSVLGAQGIGTSYFEGNDIPNQVLQNLANGESVILLGKDANNKSKENSPFGPNGHYVVATGLDKNGNIIISDPESKAPRTYDKSILTKANIGISTTAGGSGSSLDTDIARKVWSYFTSVGYSPAATAGILGNLYAESGVNPASIQGGGKGPAAGIAQWENYNSKSARWKSMADYAQSKGYQWTELTPQLEFINQEVPGLNPWFKNNANIEGYNVPPTNYNEFIASTDPQMAAMQFEKGFERAGKPNMKKRIDAAAEYYKLYQDSSYTGNWTPEAPNPNASVGVMSSGLSDTGSTTDNVSSTEDSSSSSSSGTKFGDIISVIGTAFSDAFGKVFNIGDTTESASTFTSNTSGNVSTNIVGSALGTTTTDSNVALGEVPQGKGNAAQLKIVQYAKSILNKDQYTNDMTLREQVGQGYSDCSSFARWAYKQALGIDPGGYTGSQSQSPLLTVVDEGTVPNKDKLEAGDLMFYQNKGNSNEYKNIGHVEIYDGNGGTIGHGSGIGPKLQNLDSYVQAMANRGQNYVQSMRYKDIAKLGGYSNNSRNTLMNAKLDSYDKRGTSYGDMAANAGGSSGLLLNARPGSYVNRSSKLYMKTPRNKQFSMFAGGASDLVGKSTDMLNGLRDNVIQKGNSGVISADLVQSLIKAIIAVLETISKNTTPIEQIYQVLNKYLGKGETTNLKTVDNTTQKSIQLPKSNSTEIDPNMKELVNTLAAIAKG